MKIFRDRPKGRPTPTAKLVAKRNAMGRWTALFVLGILALGLTATANRQILMPGPLAAAHGSQSECDSCHANVGSSKFGWLHQVVAPSSPERDSKTCLACHTIARSPFNPHGVAKKKLQQRTQRLGESNKLDDKPLIANLRSYLFPAKVSTSDGVFCATCHTEHQGQSADLKNVSDGRCQACHVVQFDDFENGHPDYRSYPFRRRTRVRFDHAKHFKQNFPEAITRKRNTGPVPDQCTDCHTSAATPQHMAVKPFDQTCASCHLRQILGEERATGPKGVALLTLPGVDVETLREKNVAIGDWPEDSEADISPLMALLIGVDGKRQALIRIVRSMDLLDLSKASDKELKAAAAFIWEVKLLLHDLITSKNTRIKERIRLATGAELGNMRIPQLVSALPRDVLVGLQQKWLPNLATEIEAYSQIKNRLDAVLADIETKPAAPALTAWQTEVADGESSETTTETAINVNAGPWRVDPFGALIKGPEDAARRAAERKQQAELEAAEKAADADGADADDSDVAPLTANVDGESWAEFGGWYRGEFAILYRPAHHKDAFLRAWLDISSRSMIAPRTENPLAKAAFEHLTGEDAQGQCTKCHSVDQAKSGRLLINWSPASHGTKASRFTRFLHEPHFGVVGEKGCLTCHTMADTQPTKSAYKSGNPFKFSSNFKAIDKSSCDSCHNRSSALQDCTLCHNYHVTKVGSPKLSTSIPKK
ncbi:MAG: hypothetical protein ACR2PA_11920 [Hyphomicrobiaceae bacterium]